ncbi:MAG: oligosaccharide flippase family protein [Candidatus Dormibacteraeota bacterium]|nr:oligosaccharide flippase family protein [Candidatus Dormibacteraeota bacterium]
MSVPTESITRRSLIPQLDRLRQSRLVRQNLILFLGGFSAGIGGFVYHAIATRYLGPRTYGEVAAIVAVFTVGTTAYQILTIVLARYAAHLQAEGRPGSLPYIARRAALVLAPPALLFLVGAALLAGPAARFLNLDSPLPLLWTALAMVAYSYLAIPRGLLQGSQHFTGFSVNLASELAVRTGGLTLLLLLGLRVNGAALALVAGAAWGILLGLYSLRNVLRLAPEPAQLRTMVHFALTAAAGTAGILLLYNVDVVLSAHFLNKHSAGVYGVLNKLGTIVYFLTLSVSQVLFPRVVEAVATKNHPGRLLLMSGGIMGLLGLCAIGGFWLFGWLVLALFGPGLQEGLPYLVLVGMIGLGLSLDNLLVQFFMAVHDRVFIPILAAACALEAALITLFHAGIGQVVGDVLTAVLLLLGALMLRWLLLLPGLRPEMVTAEDD